MVPAIVLVATIFAATSWDAPTAAFASPPTKPSGPRAAGGPRREPRPKQSRASGAPSAHLPKMAPADAPARGAPVVDANIPNAPIEARQPPACEPPPSDTSHHVWSFPEVEAIRLKVTCVLIIAMLLILAAKEVADLVRLVLLPVLKAFVRVVRDAWHDVRAGW